VRVLQVGAGSMGSRRMRHLCRDPQLEIRIFDERVDRRDSATERFGVMTTASFAEALAWDPEALVISTPPHQHADYVRVALERGIHFFCEADIWPYDFRAVEDVARERGIVAAPSCTLYFQPLVQELHRVVNEELGGLHAYGYVLSVDAPAWHPGEGAEYYARHRSTAPAREMVAFELIALDRVFGEAAQVAGAVHRRGTLEMDSEDSWSLQMGLSTAATGQLTVVMASPQTARRGWAVGDGGFIAFDLLAGTLERALPGRAADLRTICHWAEELEPTYAREIGAFIGAIRGEGAWPYSYRKSSAVCGTLAAAELSMMTGRIESVNPDRLPAELPDAYSTTV
jgi:predicted dehydrogenase